jgi:YgiT-type zinc finger domain-containing protein
MKDGDKCPVCGKGKLKKEVITETFEYCNRYCKIENYVIYKCSTCNEALVEDETAKRSSAIIRPWIDAIKKAEEEENKSLETLRQNVYTRV